MNTYFDIFSNPKTLFEEKYLSSNELMDNCIFILDTNVLLLPYKVGSNELKEIAEVYERLLKDNRLFIPARVAQEFAKQRPIKLSDMHHAISDHRSRVNMFKFPEYKMLSELPEYKEMIEIQSELNKLANKYKQSIKKISEYTKRLNWDDPVSKLYSEIFKSNYIFDYELEYKQMESELSERHKFNIPPAYMDKSKGDGGIGDYIIWKEILEAGLQLKTNIIFVTGDEKADWYHQSNKAKLFPRFELLNEFKNYTNGKDMSIISLSQLLEYYSKNESAISKVKESEVEENKLSKNDVDKARSTEVIINNIINEYLSEDDTANRLTENAISKWIKAYCDAVPTKKKLEFTMSKDNKNKSLNVCPSCMHFGCIEYNEADDYRYCTICGFKF